MRASKTASRLWLLSVAILVLQAAATYGLARKEYLPTPPALDSFPRSLGEWNVVRQRALQPAIYEMLRPDDFLNWSYQTSDLANEAELFVAYYKTQHRARNAHDPKVCLPGSGWEPQESRTIRFDVPAASRAVLANYYRIRKGSQEAVVLYWYQTHNATIALEQALRLRRIVDTVFDRRTDLALVRIVVPVTATGRAAATERAIRFSKLAYVQLLDHFPETPAG